MKIYQIPTFKGTKNKIVCYLNVCIHIGTTDEKIYFKTKGVSKRHPDDKYNKVVGERLAESRASKEALKIAKRYLNALKKETVELNRELDKSIAKIEVMTKVEGDHLTNLKLSADSKVFS